MQYKRFVRRPCRIFLLRKKKLQLSMPLLLRNLSPTTRRLNRRGLRSSLPIATWQIRLKPLIRPSIVSSLQSPFPILVFINMVAVYTRISHFSIFVTILRSFPSPILCVFHFVVNGLQNGCQNCSRPPGTARKSVL